MKIDAWFADLDTFTVSDNSEMLSPLEQKRVADSRCNRRRHELSASFIMRRSILSERLGVAPESLEFSDPDRPLFVRNNRGYKLSFSRQGRFGLLAMTRLESSRPIGVDLVLEHSQTESGPWTKDLLEKVAAPTEPITLDTLPRFWASKEAVAKAAGCGLRLDPRRISCNWPADSSLLSRGESRLLGGRHEGWSLASLALGPLLAVVACSRRSGAPDITLHTL